MGKIDAQPAVPASVTRQRSGTPPAVRAATAAATAVGTVAKTRYALSGVPSSGGLRPSR